MSHLSDECERLINYLIECIDFNITTNKHDIVFEDYTLRRREYRSDVAIKMDEFMDGNLNKLKTNFLQLQVVSLESRENMLLIYAGAYHFILRVKELIIRTCKGEDMNEQFFIDMMLKFGEIFCLITNSGGSKRRHIKVGDVMVTSVPDISYGDISP